MLGLRKVKNGETAVAEPRCPPPPRAIQDLVASFNDFVGAGEDEVGIVADLQRLAGRAGTVALTVGSLLDN